ncbi:MAG: YidC/Oxa1 family membrane protein insertase [Actinomycetota bacterium]
MGTILEPIEKILFEALKFFYGYVHSYGLAIILLTVAVKVTLLPLTIKQIKSAQELQRLQPKLKKIQEKYKHDKEKLQKELMKFYSEHKVNPLSGCLPLLLQLPIFIALFRMLSVNKELAQAGFLWLTNLSKPDPYFILVVLIVVSTYLSSKTMGTDPQQEKMMTFMSLFMGLIALRLPAGVLLYWVTFNVLTVIQQYLTLRFESTPVLPSKAEELPSRGKERV